MFAGPNGSGKSTLRDLLSDEWVGIYVNADEIELKLRTDHRLDLRAYGLEVDTSAVRNFWLTAPLVQRAGLGQHSSCLEVCDGSLIGGGVPINSYTAAAIAAFIRDELIVQRVSFTFETVMSSADKLETMSAARRAGYRIYLYYICTEDPQINVARVANRVRLGGHDVPEEKVVSRYERSLALLSAAIRLSDRAYIFDNSGDRTDRVWIAEVTGGTELVIQADVVAHWFQRAVLEGFD